MMAKWCLSHFSSGRGGGVRGEDFQSSGFVGREVGASPVLPARDGDSGLSQGLDGSDAVVAGRTTPFSTQW